MESVIKWQTGKPKEEGCYLVTDKFGKVCPDYWGIRIAEERAYHCWCSYAGNDSVVAWCPLSGIEPYKEEVLNTQQRAQLYELLLDCLVTETCDDCQHFQTFTGINDNHPCHRCSVYDKYLIADNVEADLKNKIKQIRDIAK